MFTIWRKQEQFSFKCDWFVLTDILLANGDEPNLILPKFARPLYFFFSSAFWHDNSRRHIDSEKVRVPDRIWTHDPPWSSPILYHWATGDSVVSKGQIVGIDWNRIARLHSHVLAHMNSLTTSSCHIKASHMNSLTASRRHIKAYRDASNQPPKWVY